jgi:transcription antitermination protein NusB
VSGRRRLGGRRPARRSALFLLYNWDLTGKPLADQTDEPVDPFALELAEAVVARSEELDRRIDEVSEGWPAGRLGVLERNILRIGISELEGDTVPPGVAIAEAVRLAKKYASPEAARLVNGILDRVAEEEAA